MGELLKKIRGNTYYIEGPVNTGVYVYDKNCCIVVDTGSSEDWGRKIYKALEAEGLHLSLIINTHSHADHFGGNNLLVKRTGAEVAATAIEAAIISNPYLEPFYLYSAHPPKFLQNKFLMGKKSCVDRIIVPGKLEVEGAEVDIVDLKGHSPGQVGVGTPDGVLMTADACFSAQIAEKYKLLYFTNIGDTLDTLKNIRETDYSYYLPCHGDLETDIKELVDVNLNAINETISIIRWELLRPMTREELVNAVGERLDLRLNRSQYYLGQSCLSAYLSYMTDRSMVQGRIEGRRMVWEAV
ncbi:MAG TPA: MBL fold metallo-hydrolase [Bacillota bacterium]|nr:MBL fold metallo-hydrolase [Bacillota bacterium]